MGGSIKYNLSHLLDFSGRDARQTFWYYVLFLVLVEYAIAMAAAIPMMAGAMSTAFEAARSGASEQDLQATMTGQMTGMMGGILWVSIATRTLMTLLLLAAFVRRLHDSNKSGWWAALAVAGQLFGIFVAIQTMSIMPQLFQDAMSAQGDPLKLQGLMRHRSEFAGYGLIGWIATLVVIGFGVLKSTDGPNRYGEAPVRF
jgi:uncharacterized membrane protein YhaH (DUF805 family)